MQKISLKDWVILLTILPTTLIGFSIAGYFSYSRFTELNDFLTERSQSIIEPLAIASTDPIIYRQREKLRHIIGFAHRNHATMIKSIAVFTKDNQVFITSAYHGDTNLMRLRAGQQIPASTSFETTDDYLIFRTPIINENSLFQASNDNTGPEVVGYIAMQIDRSKIRFNQQSQLLVAFSIVLLGSLLSGIFTFKLIQNVTRPVSSMVQAVDRIREGKLESRVNGQLIGELNFLKNGINAMAQSLGDYHDEMQRSIDQATIDLRDSLEQFEIQNVELNLAKRKAQDANRVKSEFLANMSHELRTPLNGVIGFTRQVLKTPLNDTQRDYIQTIERSANNLLAIINDILDFSKLDAGKMIIENIPFTLRDSVDEAITLLAPSAHKKNIELSVRIAQHLPDSLIGDAMRIKQVLTNLANNALKFTEKGSVTVDIDSEHIDKQSVVIKVTVSDTGIGMNSEQQDAIFEAFGQADKSITRLYGGTGLGLVISQRLAREMHGDIGFISEGGRGSTFWFTFQCEINPLQMAQLEAPLPLKKKRILYFETQTHSRIATSEILQSWQMDITPVTTLDELSSALNNERQRFDLALISHDVSPTAVSELKELVTLTKSKIDKVYLAINSNSPSLQELLVAGGANACLSKPLTRAKLLKAMLGQNNHQQQEQTDNGQAKVPIKVLAVDDNEANLKLIKALLLEQVNEVVTASHGQEAVEYCQSEKYALIFMDIQMPTMDGISALKAIKAETFNDDTPIVAVTAHALAGEKEKLLQLGFSAYITKPIDEAMLHHTIYEYCDLDLFISPVIEQVIEATPAPLLEDKEAKSNAQNGENGQADQIPSDIIDWPLALTRVGNKEHIAEEMFAGLIASLPSYSLDIEQAIESDDKDEVKRLVHKLNGACCYTAVPNLSKTLNVIETSLKQEASLVDVEPELFELEEHVNQLLNLAPSLIETFSHIPND